MNSFDDSAGGDAASSIGRSILGPALTVCCGLTSTALSAALIYWLGALFPAFDLMQWTIKRLLPVGPLLIGLAGGCGYGLGCWIAGERVRIRFLILVVALQAWAYAMWQYEVYKSAVAQGLPAANETFFQFFDRTTRKTLITNRIGQLEQRGAEGYVIRSLEFLGLAFGGVVGPLALFWDPYCERCGRYMQTKALGSLPPEIDPARFLALDRKKSKRQQAARELADSHQGLAKLKERVAVGSGELIHSELIPIAQAEEQFATFSHRVDVLLNRCKRCGHGHLRIRLIIGDGSETEMHDIIELPADPQLLAAL